MDEDAKRAATLELDSRFLARRGEAKLDELQALVDRARELLTSGEVEPDLAYLEPLAPPHEWELSTPPSGTRNTIWLASVEDFATGSGHSAHVLACLARDEDEVRRLMSASFGRILANGATIGAGLYSDVPHVRAMLPHWMYMELDRVTSGASTMPAILRFQASYHANWT